MNKLNKLSTIVDRYRENKLAHAYLIETNNINLVMQELLEVIKIINCESKYSEECNKCSLCNLININNLPTLKIIEPDGVFIKKAQVLELKEKFSAKPLYSKYNIYIIKEADKLNASSANTMLKFLEEPSGQVVGFFVTSNKDNVLLTIQSRCQLIKANYNDLIDTNIKKGDLEKILPTIYKYIELVENNNDEALLKNKEMIVDNVLSIVNVESVLKLIFNVYLNSYYAKFGYISFNKVEDYKFLLNNSLENLLKKIALLQDYLSNSTYNLNAQLLFDKIVIEIGEING